MATKDKHTQAKVLAALKGGRRLAALTIATQLGKRASTAYQTLRILEERGEVQRTPGDPGGNSPQLWYIPDGPSLREARRLDGGLPARLLEEDGVLYKDLLKIESGIPVPPQRAGIIGFTEALKRMSVGDSVLLPTAARGGQRYAQAKRLGMKIISREVGNGKTRIWRVK
jgi:hypothetical protein